MNSDTDKTDGRLLRGAFINTGKANCSIFESGRMVYECIADPSRYAIDYYSLDTFDTDHFARTGAIRLSDYARGSGWAGDYDFWIFNWHFHTMGTILPVGVLQLLSGRKFSIVLELDPDNPLALIPQGAFDGHIALDPNVERRDGIFPFPRPLEGQPRKPAQTSNGVPTIGSFGFGTPGKGFELLVEAVNREFDKATIRINVPSGTYTQGFDSYHRQAYPRHIESVCRSIAKPGINLVFTSDFMSPEAVVDWCAANDLNCFMYTRRQTGLSATTDQAIISGRPLLTLGNDTFRHIHKYIRPYPEVSFREALASHAGPVARIQEDWSRENFQRTFDEMLQSFGLLQNVAAMPLRVGETKRVIVLHAHFDGNYRDDPLSYTKRLTDSMKRVGDWSVATERLSTAEHLRDQVAKLRPDIVVLSEVDRQEPSSFSDALVGFAGPTVVVSDEIDCWMRPPFSVQAKRPIIPFFTVQTPLRDGPPAIWLIGFDDPASELEEAVSKIARELQTADILVPPLQQKNNGFEKRVAALQEDLKNNPAFRVILQPLPATGREVVEMLGAGSLIVIHADPRHRREIEAIASLSMITERAVAFARAATPSYARKGRIFEDSPVPDLIDLGLAAQIKLVADLGEWTMARDIRALCRGWPNMAHDATMIVTRPRSEENTLVPDRLFAHSDSVPRRVATFLKGLNGRWLPSLQSMRIRNHLSFVNGVSPLKRLRSVAPSPECQGTLPRGSDDRSLTADRILAVQDDSAFIRTAHSAALDRLPDPEGEAHYRAQLASGKPRGLVLLDIATSSEAKARGRLVPGLTGLAWRIRLHRLPLIRGAFRQTRPGRDGISLNALRSHPRNANCWSAAAILDVPDDEEFIRAAYQAALGRLPDPDGGASHRALLLGGRKRGWILLGIATTPEAQAKGLWIAGLRGLSWRMRLHSLPLVRHVFRWTRPGRDRISQNALRGGSASVAQSLRAIEYRLQRISEKQTRSIAQLKASLRPAVSSLNAANPSTSCLSPEAFAQNRFAPEKFWKPDGEIFLLAGVVGELRGSLLDGVLQFSKAHSERGRGHLVAWNSASRKLHAIDTQSGLSRMRDGQALHPAGDGQRKGWLLVLEPLFGVPGSTDIVAVDVIMEAHRLGMRTALVFHGAAPPRSHDNGNNGMGEAYGAYMQALLLADAILPTSEVAARELSTILSQHHSATWGSPIAVVAPPADPMGWPGYTQAVERALLAIDPAWRIQAIYYWIEPAIPNYPFSLQLASALASAGVRVIPVCWDGATGSISHAGYTLGSSGASAPWSDWIDPGALEAPDWVLAPSGWTKPDFDQISPFATANGLRVAVILGEETLLADEAAYTRLAGTDKVLALSDGDYEHFYGFLLSWKGKMHSAEDRFGTLPSPYDKATRERNNDAWANYVWSLRAILATDRLRDAVKPIASADACELIPALAPRPKLSVCLSTFNRAGWLKRNLENIYSQISPDREDLEVLVVDNTSTDNTSEVAALFRGKANFRYVRNPKNVGMLGNLAVTAQRARGEYIWILGDDDLTRAGCINKVLDVLRAHSSISLIYLNYGYTSESNPLDITDLPAFLDAYNVLEPAGPDELATVSQLAAKNENFYTAIYSHVYRRDHAMRAYCQNTNGRPFSTMLTCVPTAYYVLHYMPDEPAYWIGEPSLVVNSNVSWVDYAPLFDLEQLPRVWDLAERNGCDPAAIDRRRTNRLWLVARMWKDIFEDDRAKSSPYFDAARVLMRLKHLPEMANYAPQFLDIYVRAHTARHPAARMSPLELFRAFRDLG